MYIFVGTDVQVLLNNTGRSQVPPKRYIPRWYNIMTCLDFVLLMMSVGVGALIPFWRNFWTILQVFRIAAICCVSVFAMFLFVFNNHHSLKL